MISAGRPRAQHSPGSGLVTTATRTPAPARTSVRTLVALELERHREQRVGAKMATAGELMCEQNPACQRLSASVQHHIERERTCLQEPRRRFARRLASGPRGLHLRRLPRWRWPPTAAAAHPQLSTDRLRERRASPPPAAWRRGCSPPINRPSAGAGASSAHRGLSRRARVSQLPGTAFLADEPASRAPRPTPDDGRTQAGPRRQSTARTSMSRRRRAGHRGQGRRGREPRRCTSPRRAGRRWMRRRDRGRQAAVVAGLLHRCPGGRRIWPCRQHRRARTAGLRAGGPGRNLGVCSTDGGRRWSYR